MNDDNNDNGNGYKQTVHKEMEYKAWNTYEIELYDCEQPPAITTHTPTAKHSNNDDSHSHRTSVFFPLSLCLFRSSFAIVCRSDCTHSLEIPNPLLKCNQLYLTLLL